MFLTVKLCCVAEVAEEVFDKCIDFPEDMDLKDPNLEITFDFEFLDDTYSSAAWGDPTHVKVKNSRASESKYGCTVRQYIFFSKRVVLVAPHIWIEISPCCTCTCIT